MHDIFIEINKINYTGTTIDHGTTMDFLYTPKCSRLALGPRNHSCQWYRVYFPRGFNPQTSILDTDLNLEPKIRKTGGILLFLPLHPHATMTYTGTALSLPLLILPSLINPAIILLLQVHVSSCCHTRVPVRSFCYITFSVDLSCNL